MSESEDKKTESKNIFKTKTFWVNTVVAAGLGAAQYTGTQLPVDNGTAAILLGMANILLRTLTSQPTHIMNPTKDDNVLYDSKYDRK